MERTHLDTEMAGPDIFGMVRFRFLPYWPLFIILSVLCLTASWFYLQHAVPVYNVSATLLIKDERKGAEENKMLDALNVYNSSKIVENEIEVIHSKALMKSVVEQLGLYANVYEKKPVFDIPLYARSPVKITAKEPGATRTAEHIPLEFDTRNNLIKAGNISCKSGEWVNTPYGTLKFEFRPGVVFSTRSIYYLNLQPVKEAATNILTGLDVSSANKLSTVVNLALKDQDPSRGEDILNTLIASYNSAAIESKNKLAANTLAFVNERMQMVQQQLDSVEKGIQAYKTQNGIVDLSDQGKLFLQSVGDNDKKLSDINVQLAVLDQVERYVKSRNSTAGIVPGTLGINDPVLTQMLQKYFDNQSQLEKLKGTTAENNPVRLALISESERIRPSILENIGSQRSGLLASRTRLEASNDQYAGKLSNIPQNERELLDISRQQAIKNNVYSFLLQKREETALSFASTVSDSRVVDLAESSLKPASPKWYLVYGIGFALALVLGMAYVVVKELMTSKVLFRSEIEAQTDIPVAGEIARVRKGRRGLVLNRQKNEFLAEQFRQLRVTTGLYGRDTNRRRVLVTSSIAGEGKSFISANLAWSLARSGKKTVLVDLDFRNPRLTRVFGAEGRPGITDYLQDESIDEIEILQPTEHTDLYVIPTGNFTENPTEILLGERLPGLFNWLSDMFDVVIMDTPPVNPVTDTYLLTEYCDQTLFVIRHGFTPRHVLAAMQGNKRVKMLKNPSLVFNAIKPRGYIFGAYGYAKGYGHEYLYRGKKAYQ